MPSSKLEKKLMILVELSLYDQGAQLEKDTRLRIQKIAIKFLKVNTKRKPLFVGDALLRRLPNRMKPKSSSKKLSIKTLDLDPAMK